MLIYEMNNTADRAFDWGKNFGNSAGPYLLLAKQDCPFEVIKLERPAAGGRRSPLWYQRLPGRSPPKRSRTLM